MVILFSLGTVYRGLDLVAIALALAAALIPDTPVLENGMPGVYSRWLPALHRQARPLMLLCLIALAIAAIYQLMRASAFLAPGTRLVLAVGLFALVLKERYATPDNHAARFSRQHVVLGAIALLSVLTSAAAYLQRLEGEGQIPPAERSWNELTGWRRDSDSHGIFLIR